jgi:hypothetical protein
MRKRLENEFERSHRRQTTWQIWVPLFSAVIVFLTLVVLTAVATANTPTFGSKWASISLIFMILPSLLVGFLLLALLCGIIYGLVKLFGVAPLGLKKAQYYTYTAAAYIRNWADKSVQPILWVKAAISQMNTFFRRIRNFSFEKTSHTEAIGEALHGTKD